MMRRSRYLVVLVGLFVLGCPKDQDDAIMLHIYRRLNSEIVSAVQGTEIPASYLAALISLESHPPGNPDSQRFEPRVYQRLLEMKNNGRSFGRLPLHQIQLLSDSQLRRLATSYGLTQIMGYHCLDLGCSIEDLAGQYHLVWSVAYIRRHYLKPIMNKEYEVCFRIHNTGRPEGATYRDDYVEKGLLRMKYYEKWQENKGNIFAGLFK